MTYFPVQSPYNLFSDTDGEPLESGYIYIGKVNQNPITNPLTVSWDIAGLYPAAQPIRTIGGYPDRNGSPGVIFINGFDSDSYSIIIQDKHQRLVFSSYDVVSDGFSVRSNVNTIGDLRGVTFFQSPIYVRGHTTIGDGGNDMFEWIGGAAPATYSDDGGTVILPTGGDGSGAFLRQYKPYVSVRDFGATGDGTTDDTANILAALESAAASNRTLFFPIGDYIVSDTIPLDDGSSSFYGVFVEGEDIHGCRILFQPATSTTPCFTMIGGSGDHTNKGIKNLTIVPDTGFSGDGVGLFINGQDFARVSDFVVEDLNYGIRVTNTTAGTFSEFNSFFRVRLVNNVYGIAFERNGGDASFHGNRLYDFEINIPDGGYGIYIAGISGSAFLYNCYFRVNLFGGTGTRTGIYVDNNNTDHNFGFITCEATIYLESTATGEFHFRGGFENLGTINYTVVNDGSFKFDNIRNNSNYTDANISSYSPLPLPPSTVDRDGNGDFPCIHRVAGTNIESVAIASYNFAGNGLFVGGIPLSGKLEDFVLGAYLWRNGFKLETHSTAGFKIKADGIEYFQVYNGDMIGPSIDNTFNAGNATYRYKEVFAVSGAINTSDEREKQDFTALTESERKVAIKIKGLIKKYKFISAVEKKGDNARWHIGVIAQEIVTAFESEGLNAFEYGAVCYDKWDSKEEKRDEVTGDIIQEKMEAGDRYSIRADELLFFMMSAL